MYKNISELNNMPILIVIFFLPCWGIEIIYQNICIYFGHIPETQESQPVSILIYVLIIILLISIAFHW